MLNELQGQESQSYRLFLTVPLILPQMHWILPDLICTLLPKLGQMTGTTKEPASVLKLLPGSKACPNTFPRTPQQEFPQVTPVTATRAHSSFSPSFCQ